MLLETTGIEEAQELFTGMADRVDDIRPVLPDVVGDLVQAERDLFTSGGMGLWSALAPETIERRKRRGVAGTRPLVATGALMRSLTVPNGPGQIREIQRDGVEFGTDLAHARYQRNRRPPVVINQRGRNRVAGTLLDYIVGGDA